MQAPFNVLVQSSGCVRSVPFNRSSLIVGRGNGADIVLADPVSSREHLLIERDREGIWLEDLGSRNGTTLSGRRISTRIRWEAGDVVHVGKTSLQWEKAVEDAPSSGDRWQRFLALMPILRFSPFARRLSSSSLAIRVRRLRSRSLPPRSGKTFFGTILVVCMLVATAAIGSIISRGEKALASHAVVQLPLTEASAELSFGNGEDADILVEGSLILEWTPRRPPSESLVWLSFQADLLPGSAGLELGLNGILLGEVRPSGRRGEWLMPAEIVLVDEPNLLSIRPLGEEVWAVRDVSMREEPRPQCAEKECIEEATKWIERGRTSYERQALDHGNLFEAWSSFRKARMVLVSLRPKPPIHATAIHYLEETGALLDERCRSLRFSVVQGIAFQREEAAWAAAKTLLQTFPDPEHPCHEQAAYYADLLNPESGGGR